MKNFKFYPLNLRLTSPIMLSLCLIFGVLQSSSLANPHEAKRSDADPSLSVKNSLDETSDDEGTGEESGDSSGDEEVEDPVTHPRVRLLQQVPTCGKEANEWQWETIFAPRDVGILLQDLDQGEIPLQHAFQTIQAIAEFGDHDALTRIFHSSEKWASNYAARIVQTRPSPHPSSPPPFLLFPGLSDEQDSPDKPDPPDIDPPPDSKATLTRKLVGNMRRTIISAWNERGDIPDEVLATGLFDEDLRVQFAAAKAIVHGEHEALEVEVATLCEESHWIYEALDACKSLLETP